jgi:hypothetical protein
MLFTALPSSPIVDEVKEEPLASFFPNFFTSEFSAIVERLLKHHHSH